MSVFLAKAFPSFHLKGDHFVTLNVIDDLSLDNSLDVVADGQLIVAVRKKDLGELDLVTGITGDPGDVQGLVFLDLELLAGYFHYC